MTEEVLISLDCYGLAKPHETADKVFRFHAGTIVRLWGEANSNYVGVVHHQLSAHVPRACVTIAGDFGVQPPWIITTRMTHAKPTLALIQPHVVELVPGTILPLCSEDKDYYRIPYERRIHYVPKRDATPYFSTAREVVGLPRTGSGPNWLAWGCIILLVIIVSLIIFGIDWYQGLPTCEELGPDFEDRFLELCR